MSRQHWKQKGHPKTAKIMSGSLDIHDSTYKPLALPTWKTSKTNKKRIGLFCTSSGCGAHAFSCSERFFWQRNSVGPEFQRLLCTSKTIEDTTENSVPAHTEQILVSCAISKMSTGFTFLRTINIFQEFPQYERMGMTALRGLGCFFF